jgi:hypothetical protein
MIYDSMKATGRLSIVVKDKNGAVKETREVENLVVTSGLEYIASRMANTDNGVMSHMALGSGTTAAAAGDTALGSELGRVAFTSATVSGAQLVYVAAFDPGTATGAVTEAGIFNAATAGTMLCRTVFDVVNKAADDSLTITWTVTIQAQS